MLRGLTGPRGGLGRLCALGGLRGWGMLGFRGFVCLHGVSSLGAPGYRACRG